MRKANFRRLLKFVVPPSTDALESPIPHPGSDSILVSPTSLS